MNNFLNNVEEKIILCRMLEIVYAENSEIFLNNVERKIILYRMLEIVYVENSELFL